MNFDIDKMKADGVDERIIRFVSLSAEELWFKIARKVENDRLFQQLMNIYTEEEIYRYAVTAGLITQSDVEWLLDEENPYLSNIAPPINNL